MTYEGREGEPIKRFTEEVGLIREGHARSIDMLTRANMDKSAVSGGMCSYRRSTHSGFRHDLDKLDIPKKAPEKVTFFESVFGIK